MSQNKTPFSHFLVELEALCGKQVTGTVYIATDKNQLAQINLDNGKIIGLSILNKSGAEAIPALSKVNTCSFDFMPSPASSSRMTLPSNAEIIFQLKGGGASAGAATTPAEHELSDKNKTVLKETLAEYLGPVADMVCKKHLAHASTLEAAVSILAEQIPDSSDADQFKKSVWQQLKAVG